MDVYGMLGEVDMTPDLGRCENGRYWASSVLSRSWNGPEALSPKLYSVLYRDDGQEHGNYHNMIGYMNDRDDAGMSEQSC